MPGRSWSSREEDLYWQWVEERCECVKGAKCEFCEEREENQKRHAAAAEAARSWQREVVEIRRLLQEASNGDSYDVKVRGISNLFRYLYMECVDFLVAQPNFRKVVLTKLEEFSGAPELTRDIKSLYETLETIKTFDGYKE